MIVCVVGADTRDRHPSGENQDGPPLRWLAAGASRKLSLMAIIIGRAKIIYDL
jgi:hypothetical protein